MDPDSPKSGPNSLSPLDWLMPSSYVTQILCFPTPADTNPEAQLTTLRAGLRATCVALPYLLAGVEPQAHPIGAVQLTAPYQSTEDLFSWQDLRSPAAEPPHTTRSAPAPGPDYAALKAAGFPPSLLGSSVSGLRPPGTTPPLAAGGAPAPVLRARATVVRGGLLLCVALHHKTADVTALGALLGIWAAACREGSPAAAGLDAGWCDRGALTRTKTGDPGPEPAPHPGSVRPAGVGSAGGARPGRVPELIHVVDLGGSAGPHARTAPRVVPEVETRIFFFPADGLAELKAAVNQQLTSSDYAFSAISHEKGSEYRQGAGTDDEEGQVRWVSTGDVMTALLWSAVTWAEHEQGRREDASGGGDDKNDDDEGDEDESATCSAAIPVNFRARYNPPLPQSYLGAAFAMITATVARADLLAASAPPTPGEGDHHPPSAAAAAASFSLSPASLTALTRLATTIRRAVARVTEARVRAALAYTAAQEDMRGIVLNQHRRQRSPSPAGLPSSSSGVGSVDLGEEGGSKCKRKKARNENKAVSLVSWADQAAYGLDWGHPVGRCEAVRLPRFAAWRYPIVLPRMPLVGDGPGGLEVVLAFDEDTVERFGRNWLISTYGRLRC